MICAGRHAAWLGGMALLPLTATPALADGLRDALTAAYRSNPTLQAARAGQRALDETVPIEKAAGLPSASVQAQHVEILNKSDNNPTGPNRLLSADLSLSVPIYSGGAVRNAIRAAETRVEAGQADLRATESAIFSQVVGAYMDVILNEAVVELNRNLVEVLDVNLQATSDRYEIGDLTRTDVAQSQARFSLARADRRASEANLSSARERYIQIVGEAPRDLQPPPPLPNMPASAQEAVAAALDNNPDILASRERTRAAEFDIRTAGAGRMPRIDVFTSAGYDDYFGTLGGAATGGLAQSETSAQAGVRATIPLFQGGRPAALRRRAQAQAQATMENEIAIERDVIAQARAMFASWTAANELIASTQTAVEAAALSLEGVRAESSVGNRSILDILDAEQELLTARVRLVTARRNAYVAGFSLLAAMGRAEAKDLNLDGGALYDPQLNYQRVRGKWFDWENDPAPAAVSTRTVDTPVQDSSIPTQ